MAKKTGKPDIRRALRRNFLFDGLTAEELEALLDHIAIQEVEAGTTIVREGDEASDLYLIIDGGVNVIKAPGQFLSYLGGDGFFGEMALFSEGTKRSATCVAVNDTTCAVFRKPELDAYCHKHPLAGIKIHQAMVRVLSERLRTTSADLAMLMKAQVKRQEEVGALVEDARRGRQDAKKRDTP